MKLKQMLALALVAAMLLSLVACGGKTAATEVPTEVQAERTEKPIPEEPPESMLGPTPGEPGPEPGEPMPGGPTPGESGPEPAPGEPRPEPEMPEVDFDVQNCSFTDSDGYNFSVAVGVHTTWIDGKDDEAIQAAWRSAGGRSALDLKTVTKVDPAETPCLLAIGYFAVTNTTSGFDVTKETARAMAEQVTLNGNGGLVGIYWLYYYGSDFNFSKDKYIEFRLLSNNSGKVPFFVMAFDSKPTPNEPNGDTKLDGASLEFGTGYDLAYHTRRIEDSATFTIVRP